MLAVALMWKFSTKLNMAYLRSESSIKVIILDLKLNLVSIIVFDFKTQHSF